MELSYIPLTFILFNKTEVGLENPFFSVQRKNRSFERKGYLPKERVENGLHRKVLLINRNENWRNDMSSYYRGAKLNRVKQTNERRSAFLGLYRGAQYTANGEKSQPATSGVYRGAKWGS